MQDATLSGLYCRVASYGKAIAAFDYGEGGSLHADPYAKKAFGFDAESGLLSLESRGKAIWNGDLKNRRGGRLRIAR